jgi:lipoic acid synthetase
VSHVGDTSGPAAAGAGRKPSWLKVRPPQAPQFRATRGVLDDLALRTVCDEARCPNKGECFSQGTATFLILGDRCTRACRFCAVERATGAAAPVMPDAAEPRRVAAAARRLGLTHVVVTSVTRDDLPDGGAGQFAATIAAVRTQLPAATVEMLVPDFGGDDAALRAVLAARPDVLGHNLETVPRLYATVRPGADYGRSLTLLERAAAWVRDAARAAAPRALIKTGIMAGLGEQADEVDDLLADCARVGADVVTIGQYLQPRRDRLPVVRYVAPGEFAAWERRGAALGLRVHAAPFVRSSYRAAEVLEEVLTHSEEDA